MLYPLLNLFRNGITSFLPVTKETTFLNKTRKLPQKVSLADPFICKMRFPGKVTVFSAFSTEGF